MVAPITEYWYLSFVDELGPPGERWLGACVVAATDIVSAARAAHALGCNPGGQVLGGPMPDIDFPTSFCNRLLGLSDVQELDKVCGGSGNVKGGNT